MLDGRTYDEVPGRRELPVLASGERLAAIREFEEMGQNGRLSHNRQDC